MILFSQFAKDLGDKLRGMGYQVSRCLPKDKDFNEELKKEKVLDKPSQQEASAANAKEDTPAVRRYGQNGERLWNGKAPESFTEQDIRQFIDSMGSPPNEEFIPDLGD